MEDRNSEVLEQQVMTPQFEVAETDEGQPRYTLLVYLDTNPKRPVLTMRSDDENHLRMVAWSMVGGTEGDNGGLEADGDFYPVHRINRVTVVDERPEEIDPVDEDDHPDLLPWEAGGPVENRGPIG